MEKINKGKFGAEASAIQIGHGRLGRHLYEHLKKYFKRVDLISGRKDLLSLSGKTYTYAFIATPDEALDQVIEVLPEETKKVHFSGFKYNCQALGLHPVMSFNKEDKYDLDEITFVSDGPLEDELHKIFKKILLIKPEYKKIYHTYLSVAANSIQLLTFILKKDFQAETQMPPELLENLVFESLKRELAKGEKSFTGPWTRGEMQNQNKVVEETKDQTLKDLNSCFINAVQRYKNEYS